MAAWLHAQNRTWRASRARVFPIKNDVIRAPAPEKKIVMGGLSLICGVLFLLGPMVDRQPPEPRCFSPGGITDQSRYGDAQNVRSAEVRHK